MNGIPSDHCNYPGGKNKVCFLPHYVGIVILWQIQIHTGTHTISLFCSSSVATFQSVTRWFRVFSQHIDRAIHFIVILI